MKPKVHEFQKINFEVMSKKIVVALLLLTNLMVLAQKPCEIDADINDTIGTYKTTKQYMVFERSFAGNSTNVFFSLANTNGILGAELQLLQKSNDFIKTTCLDSSSKIFIQLQNGKIVTLFHTGADSCGSLLRDDKNMNNRIIMGTFLFSKENYEELKISPVTFIRIQFIGETADYPFKTGFVSVLDKKMYEPEKYFMDYLKCIEN